MKLQAQLEDFKPASILEHNTGNKINYYMQHRS